MKVNKKLYLYRSVQESNILPLTSRCNASCIFCSHKQNPPGVEVYSVGELPVEEIKNMVQFLQPGRPIVIGESVTRVIEGEPLFHSRFREVLLFLRRHFPKTTIQITTNGILLDQEMVNFLAEIKPVRLYLSLNSSSPEIRKKVMGINGEDWVFSGLNVLQELNIPFYGSVLALPWLTGYDDLKRTLMDLKRWGAQMARVFLPGFTRYARKEIQFDKKVAEDLKERINDWQMELDFPLLLEPPLLSDLNPEIAGTLPESPAQKAGLKSGDVIELIDGVKPFSRVDAFEKIKNAQKPEIIFKRDGRTEKINIIKEGKKSSGLVVAYDISEDRIKKIRYTIEKNNLENVLLMASPFGRDILATALTLSDKGLAKKIRITSAKSYFFGGNIGAAGLLVLNDYLNAWKEVQGDAFDAILLPSESFDWWGRDLQGISYQILNERTGIPVYIV